MLTAVYTILILLFLLPFLAEVRMVLRSMLFSCLGRKEGQRKLQAMSFADRLTLRGIRPLLDRHLREYGQYMRLQLFAVLAAALAIALEIVFIELRAAVPALLVCILFCAGAFAGISLVHAHAGYDPEKHTTRYDRAADR